MVTVSVQELRAEPGTRPFRTRCECCFQPFGTAPVWEVIERHDSAPPVLRYLCTGDFLTALGRLADLAVATEAAHV